MQPEIVQCLTKHSYHQISALPDLALDDLSSSSPSKTKVKDLTMPLVITVLIKGAVRCMTVRQLYSQDMRTLPPLYPLAPTACFQ
jgi:hypothetical protein